MMVKLIKKRGKIMKFIISVLIGIYFIAFPSEVVMAQVEKGDKELSISTSFMSRKYKGASEAEWVFNLASRLGLFVTRNIEIEPELLACKWKEEDFGFVLSGNVLYNIIPANPMGSLLPFVLVGIGYANSMTFLPTIVGPSWGDKISGKVFNVGGGLKAFMSESVIIRIDYRFQKWSYDVEYDGYDDTQDYSDHLLLLGISALLK